MEIRLLSTWPICQESPDNDYNEHDHNDDQDDKECIKKRTNSVVICRTTVSHIPTVFAPFLDVEKLNEFPDPRLR